MKKTEADRHFAKRFAEELLPHVTEQRNRGKSLAEIATRLGVTGAGLQKQLDGGTPSIRTIALAYALYGVSVRYEGIEVTKAISSKRKKKGQHASTEIRQLVLPFEITTPVPPKDMVLKLIPRGIHRYRLQLTVGVSR
jgi:hypothetical protein